MKTVAITGAAGGIGRALAIQYASQGWQVLGFDNDETELLATEKLMAGRPGRFRPSITDLTDEEDRHRLIEVIQRRGGVDLFIHNAALNLVGAFENLNFRQQRELIDLNLTTPMTLTRALLAENLLKENGTLVYMSSLSWFVGYPGAAVYAATKDALAHYARSLRLALRPRGMHVLTVYPGPVDTSMASRCSPGDEKSGGQRMPPQEVARLIADAVERRRPELIPGFRNRIFAFLGTWFPGSTERVMKRNIYDRLDRARHPQGLSSGDPASR